MELSFSPAELVAMTAAPASRGATTQTIRGIASLAEAAAGDLSFLGNAKYKPEVARSQASVVLLPSDYAGDPRPDQLYLLVENPSVALARVCARLEQQLWPKPTPGVHPSAIIGEGTAIASSATIGPLCVVEPGARIGEGVHLEAQVFVGRRAVLGEGCWLGPGVVLMAECELGRRVRLHPGVAIGSDGFGYEFVRGRHEKVPQVGTVVIGDDVEIGANTAVDRARFGRTIIGEGTKIDNLVQVGHNVRIGCHCVVCGQVGISGSATIGDYVVLGGKAGLAGHLTVGRGAKVGGAAGVAADIAPGEVVNGNPAIPYMLERRIAVLKTRLPELFRRVDALETQVLGGKKLSPAPRDRKMPAP